MRISPLVLDLIEASAGRRTAEAIGLSFFDSLKPFGAVAISAGAYGSPTGGDHPDRTYARAAPASFMPMYDDDRLYRYNPLPGEARRRTEPFAWSDVRWDGTGPTWVRETMRDCGCPDGLYVPCHGPNGYLGVVSVAFAQLGAIAPAERAAIELAAHVLHGRMRALARPPPRPRAAALTQRERDCLMFVSEGRSDAAIAATLGITRRTVAFHLAQARAKLGAKTRAQAVAALLGGGSALR